MSLAAGGKGKEIFTKVSFPFPPDPPSLSFKTFLLGLLGVAEE